MFKLQKTDIHLNQQAEDKTEAIKKVAQALTDANFVESGYVNGMLERESQAATYLGSGIAIPHGTTTTRHLVKKTGVQVFCFPQGVAWGDDGELCYLAIGIAASSDEHLTLLRQLTHVLGDDDIESKIKNVQSAEEIIAILTGTSQTVDNTLHFDHSSLLLDVTVDSLSTLQALNASRLKRIDAVNTQFIVGVLDNRPNYLGQGIWLNDFKEGNLKNAIVITRTSSTIEEAHKPVKMLITVSTVDHSMVSFVQTLSNLMKNNQLEQLANADSTILLKLINPDVTTDTIESDENTVNISLEHTTGDNNPHENSLTQEFIVVNSNGLHTRPSSLLVKLIKSFNSVVTVANLDGSGNTVNATSLMKVVALGAKKGSHLRFTATGDDAAEALDAIGKAIAEGFGEETE